MDGPDEGTSSPTRVCEELTQAELELSRAAWEGTLPVVSGL